MSKNKQSKAADKVVRKEFHNTRYPINANACMVLKEIVVGFSTFAILLYEIMTFFPVI